MNVWPATLPPRSLKRGATRTFGDARLKTRTDAGGGTSRRRLSYMPDPFVYTANLTEAQLDILETFVKVTLQGGALPFHMPAQDQKEKDGVWVVQIGDRMPSFEPIGKNLWSATLSLIRLPQ